MAAFLAVFPTTALAAPPPNDDFNSAQVIASLPYSQTLDTREATAASDDPRPCFTYVDRTVWFAYTPSESGYLEVTGGTGYTDMGVFRGSRGSLVNVACDDYAGNMRFKAIAATTYYFMAGGPYLESLTFNLAAGPAGPANDYVDGAEAVDALPFHDDLDLTLATDSPLDPYCARGKSVWYSFTPAEAMRVQLTSPAI